MPKLPINYKNALIYKICCNDPNITDIYIGSTTNFYQRTRAHKTSCNNPNGKSYNLHVYKFIRDNGGWKNWRMDLIEFYECNNKLELLRREGELIKNLKPTLNKDVPGRTQKEYYENNKEKIKEKIKEYYKNNIDKIKEYKENNKEKIKEKQKEYKENNKEKLKEFLKEYKNKKNDKLKIYQKQFYEVNKDKLKEKAKIYYEKNKDKVKDKLKEKAKIKRQKKNVLNELMKLYKYNIWMKSLSS